MREDIGQHFYWRGMWSVCNCVCSCVCMCVCVCVCVCACVCVCVSVHVNVSLKQIPMMSYCKSAFIDDVRV